MSNQSVIVETHNQIALDFMPTSQGIEWQYLSDVTLEDNRRVYVVETIVYADEDRSDIVDNWWIEVQS